MAFDHIVIVAELKPGWLKLTMVGSLSLVGSELRVRVSVADRLRVEIIQGIRCGVRDNIGID